MIAVIALILVKAEKIVMDDFIATFTILYGITLALIVFNICDNFIAFNVRFRNTINNMTGQAGGLGMRNRYYQRGSNLMMILVIMLINSSFLFDAHLNDPYIVFDEDFSLLYAITNTFLMYFIGRLFEPEAWGRIPIPSCGLLYHNEICNSLWIGCGVLIYDETGLALPHLMTMSRVCRLLA